jgi:hypothetical protein
MVEYYYQCFINWAVKLRLKISLKSRVSDPYSIFTDPDPDPEDPDGGQYGYGSGSGSNPDPGL